jgi:hypothetical protein
MAAGSLAHLVDMAAKLLESRDAFASLALR